MTVARENRDNPLLRTTMLIRCTYIYIYIYLYRRLSTLQLRHIYAYGNVSEICAHVRILRVSRNFFFFFVLEDILEVTLQNDENILSILYFKCCSTLKCWYYYSVFSRGTLYCQIFSILYALIVFSNFVAKIPFIKFLYISYCSVVIYDFFFFIIGINAFGLIFYL